MRLTYKAYEELVMYTIHDLLADDEGNHIQQIRCDFVDLNKSRCVLIYRIHEHYMIDILYLSKRYTAYIGDKIFHCDDAIEEAVLAFNILRGFIDLNTSIDPLTLDTSRVGQLVVVRNKDGYRLCRITNLTRINGHSPTYVKVFAEDSKEIAFLGSGPLLFRTLEYYGNLYRICNPCAINPF